MPKGYHGKVLIVNLTEQKWHEEQFDEKIYRQYYGGYGLGVYYIYKHLKPGIDPLGEENILGFCPGLLTGSPVPFSGRVMVCGKSPLTGKGKVSDGQECSGGWGNANSGGTFGPEIKRAGYDAIFFEGIAAKPTYLLIDGTNISLVDAAEIWGKDAIETEKYIAKTHGSRVKVACIGPAGEKLSLIAGVVNDSGRLAARSGLGAVMGSKKLKALCIRGDTKANKIDYHDREDMMVHVKEYLARFRKLGKKGLMTKLVASMDMMAPLMRVMKIGNDAFDSPAMAKTVIQMFSAASLGTTVVNVTSTQNGDSPIKNFKGIGYKDFSPKHAKKFGGKKIRKMMKTPYGCFACPARCGAILEYEGLPYPEKETHRPEYETCIAFGGLILNDDLDLLLKVNELLNRAGMDTISAGSTIAFVYECCERGLLAKKDFICKDYPEGFLPSWTNQEYLLQILKMMINREGIGDILADGTRAASEKIPRSRKFSMAANGQEIPMHDPRLDPMLGVTYITDPTPGRHTAASLNFEMLGAKYFLLELGDMKPKDDSDLGILQAKTAKFHQTMEANGMCIFAANMGLFPYLQVMRALTGWDITYDELMETGHRIQTLRQMFNAREGAIRHEIPQRAIGSPPLAKGPLKNKSIDLESIAQVYYDSMGFETNGVPKKETLEKLSLDFAIADLKNAKGIPEPLVNDYITQDGKKNEINTQPIPSLRGG